jgi:hypothetical protein
VQYFAVAILLYRNIEVKYSSRILLNLYYVGNRYHTTGTVLITSGNSEE